MQRPSTGFMCELRVSLSEKSTKINMVNNSFFEFWGMPRNCLSSYKWETYRSKHRALRNTTNSDVNGGWNLHWPASLPEKYEFSLPWAESEADTDALRTTLENDQECRRKRQGRERQVGWQVSYLWHGGLSPVDVSVESWLIYAELLIALGWRLVNLSCHWVTSILVSSSMGVAQSI
jgi:hypothetical protein